MLALQTVLFVVGQGLPIAPIMDHDGRMAPNVTVADTAVIIERVGIEDTGRRASINLLIELHDDQWREILADYQLAVFEGMSTRGSEQIAAEGRWREAHHQAKAASITAHAIAARYRDAPSDARSALYEQLTDARAHARALRIDAREALTESRLTRTTDQERLDKALMTFLDRHDDLSETLRINIGLLLSPDETPAWNDTWAQLQRSRKLRMGMLSGESLDLDALIRGMTPGLTQAERSSIDPTLVHWRAHIDEALEARAHGDYDDGGAVGLAVRRYDEDTALDLLIDRLERAREVRDINLEFVEALTAALGEPQSARLHQTAMNRAFPALMRTTAAEMLLNRLDEHARVTDADRDHIQELRADHVDRMVPVRTRLIEAWIKIDGTENLRAIRARAGITEPSADRRGWREAQNALAREYERVKTALVPIVGKYRVNALERGLPVPVRIESRESTP